MYIGKNYNDSSGDDGKIKEKHQAHTIKRKYIP